MLTPGANLIKIFWRRVTTLLSNNLLWLVVESYHVTRNGQSDVFISLSPGHEVEEAVELDEAAAVGVDDGHDALEVDLSLETKKGPNVQKEC